MTWCSGIAACQILESPYVSMNQVMVSSQLKLTRGGCAYELGQFCNSWKCWNASRKTFQFSHKHVDKFLVIAEESIWWMISKTRSRWRRKGLRSEPSPRSQHAGQCLVVISLVKVIKILFFRFLEKRRLQRRTLRTETIFCNWKPFKNDGKWFLFQLKSSFRSQDI